jgi:hypothetical protein
MSASLREAELGLAREVGVVRSSTRIVTGAGGNNGIAQM